MTGLDWAAIIALGGMLVISLAASYLRPRSTHWARRWLEREVGGSSPRLIEQMAPVLLTRARTGLVGALVGGVVGLAFVFTVDLVPDFPAWTGIYLGAYAGHLIGLGSFAVVRITRVVPEPGVRVALSNPPRTGWFVSRPALVIFILAATVQLTSTALNLVEPSHRAQLDLTDVVLIVTSVGIVVATAVASVRYIPWLVHRPIHARDEYELRTEVALRRDQIDDVVAVYLPVLGYAGMWSMRVAGGEVLWPYGLACALAFLATMVQIHTVADHPIRSLPPRPAPRPAPGEEATAGGSWPDSWEPAPGTDGWTFSRRARRSAH